MDPTALLNKVYEDTKHSYYNVTQPQLLHPFQGQTNPDVSLVGGTNTQYSWLKAPRYTTNRTVCEVGPLARMVVSYLAETNGAPTAKKAKLANTGGTDSAVFSGLPALYSAYDIVLATYNAVLNPNGLGLVQASFVHRTVSNCAAR